MFHAEKLCRIPFSEQMNLQTAHKHTTQKSWSDFLSFRLITAKNALVSFLLRLQDSARGARVEDLVTRSFRGFRLSLVEESEWRKRKKNCGDSPVDRIAHEKLGKLQERCNFFFDTVDKKDFHWIVLVWLVYTQTENCSTRIFASPIHLHFRRIVVKHEFHAHY